ncbi:hypothetical protein [Vibrio crassostreae]|uniref:hypothetical protein n=1 Tax=Vibrio crassostreae TaxID=246167 RepID=UPI00063602B5|nr:hypothetical protein [Vibrio crassostreae]CAH6804163.1 conserved hypothetical protein [Vibrio chagasii]CAH6815488.1 conserved hypothetical protein [Vibrio chagasii]CAH6819014.1 conserved hypothetical protein [Vibrio chagasii]CAH6826173.1 conserved hypothetical protein [Vibrio chagasii]CAH6862607.1 conserved hypothetical protein [Vibrio chagasii]
MANKFFLITCKSKKTKHREGEVTIAFPLTANTQADAKKVAWETLADKDEQGTIEFFQVPHISRITEEEYNELLLDNEADQIESELEDEQKEPSKNWPQLNSSGFYDKDSEGLLRATITQEENIAEILVLQTAPEMWVFGYRYVTQSSSLAKPTSHAQGEYESIEEAILDSTNIVFNIAEFQSQHSEGNDQTFAKKVLDYDFGKDILSQLEVATEDQMDIEEQIDNQSSATLPHQTDIDVSSFNIGKTKRIELAVMPQGDQWIASFAFTDSANPDNDLGNIRTFLKDTKSTKENAINLAMGHAGNWLFKVDEVTAAKDFFKGNIAETFDNGISHAIVINKTEPKEPLVSQETMDKIKEVGKVFKPNLVDHYIPKDATQRFVYDCLATIDDSHLDLTEEQYQEAGDKVHEVLKELAKKHAGFNQFYTLEAMTRIDWDSGTDAKKTFLNIRTLRSTFNENMVKVQNVPEPKSEEPEETPSFQDWSKTNKGKSFDDYAEEFNIDSTVATSQSVEHPELLEAITKRMEGEKSPATPEQVHTALCTNITDETDVKALSEAVLTLKNPAILWHSTTSVNLIQNHTKHPEQPTYDKVEKPKQAAPLFDKENEWQLFTHQLLSIGGNDAETTEKQYVTIAGNIQAIFWATGYKLKVGKFYTEIASGFMDQIRNVEDVMATLMDAKTTRDLINETINSQKAVETKPEETNEPIEVPEQITEQEPANDPIPEVKTIADLPDSYLTNPNLALFMQGFETDLAFTKQDHNGRLSIKTQYRIMRATAIWGPIGVGWGYEVKREWTVKGAPIIMNGAITEHHEQVHKCEIIFWYMHDDKRIEFTQYGDTRKLYMSQYGKFIHDDEVEKKSLSDALGKAMSMTGLCADIYLGTYDDSGVMNKAEQMNLAKKKVQALEFDGQASEAALTKAKSYTDKFANAPSLAEIKRLEKLAIAALDAMPKSDNESREKQEKCIERVKQQAQEAIHTFTQDLQAHKEKA